MNKFERDDKVTFVDDNGCVHKSFYCESKSMNECIIETWNPGFSVHITVETARLVRGWPLGELTLREQIVEQEKIRKMATQERNRLIELRDCCKHKWEWDLSNADVHRVVIRTCMVCGLEEIFNKEK